MEIICPFLSSFFFFSSAERLNNKVYLAYEISKSAYVFLPPFFFFRNQQSRAPAGDSPGRINKKRQVGEEAGAEETRARISSRPNFASRECFIEKFEGNGVFRSSRQRERERVVLPTRLLLFSARKRTRGT